MEKVKVELLTQHEHGGLVRNKGDVLDLYVDQANVLIAKNIAKKMDVRSVRDRADKE